MEEVSEFDFHELLYRLRKRWVMILVITLISTVGTWVISSYFITPVYEAEIGIIIGKVDNSTETTSSDITMYQNLTETYKAIALTNKVASDAALSLNDVDSEELLNKSNVTTQSGTMIMNIAVRDQDPNQAKRVVDAYSRSFVDRANELLPDGEVTIIDASMVPTMAISPNVKMNVAIGFVLGLMASMGIAILLEQFNRTIVSAEDIEMILHTPLIGMIPEMEEK